MAKLSSILSVVVLGDTKQLEKSMKGAQASVKGLERSIAGSAKNINRAFGAIGVGFGAAGLLNLAKAASADKKSFEQMAQAVRNATGATDAQIASSEAYIQTMSNQLGIMDDDLRPAFETLASGTGDLTQAQNLLGFAADIAARYHITLTEAASKLSKAQNGNFKALTKLEPALIGVTNPMEKLQQLTEGSAKAAANNDPWARLQVIFDNFQETLGQYLLPYLEQFATWLASPGGQEQIKQIAAIFANMVTNVGNFVTFLANNKWVIALVAGVMTAVKVFRVLYQVQQMIYNLTKARAIAEAAANAATSGMGWGSVAMIGTAIAAGVASFVVLDNLMGNMPNTDNLTSPAANNFTLQAGSYGVDPKSVSSAADKAKSELEKATQTIQNKLKEVQGMILNMSKKFFEAVDLGFGVISRASGKVFRADRYVRELKRMQNALRDYMSNFKKLQAIGGAKATPLLNQILGMGPEEAAAIVRGFVQSPNLFAEAVNTTAALATQGAAIGRAQSTMLGNQTEQQLLAEMKLLRADLASGKNTYNIKGTMTATEILAAIRKWERANGRKVLVG